MKVSSSWVREWLGRTMLSDQDMVQALERAGMEIEQVNSSTQIDERVVVALVKKVVQHPGADRLKIAAVTTGERELSIVCGAPNVREGLKVALAQIGSTLPAGEKIQKAKLRGEVSEGMLCSERELGLGKDHNGILELPSDAVIGTPLCDLYPADTEIDLKTPANRFDVLSVVGLAREVAAMTKAQLAPLSPPVLSAIDGPAVAADAQAARYMLARVKVNQAAPTPRQMAARLRVAGMRPLSPVVDVTNYVMLELGQPLHAFDADKVKLPVAVRQARPGESLTTLDGVQRTLSEQDLVIADKTGPIALAGLMGGASTEVGPATREILLESAVFDGTVVRKMAKRHGLRTEASARFERGLPVKLSPLAVTRALQLLGDVAGGQLLGVTDQLNVWPWVQRIGLRITLLSKLLGFGITHKQATEALAKLQITSRPFDISAEAQRLIGKSYKLGASYKTDGTEAFDCSYLVDYLYSLIGVQVGFSALGQYELGRPVEDQQLLPGDTVFTRGDNDDAPDDHYYTRNADGKYVKHAVKPARRVGHVGLYIGEGKVVQASSSAGKVVVTELEKFTNDPHYLGARRHLDDLADYITVPDVPWWRTDLKLPEDLVEEVVRVVGYDNVPSSIPPWRPQILTFDRAHSKRRRVRNLLYASGLFEVMTYSFVSQEQLENLGHVPKDHLKLKNPLSSEQAYLRSTLLPSHLAVLAKNRTYAKEIGFYEISKVFVKRGKEQPDEPLRLAVTLARPELALAHAKGILDALAREFNVELRAEPRDNALFAPGRSGELRLGKERLGWIGQVHPERVRELKVDAEVGYFEIDLTPLMESGTSRQFLGLEKFPTISRDLAVLLPAAVTWAEVEEALSPHRIEFVGDYHGGELPEGYKGLTLRLTVASPDRTPTEPEAAELEAALRRLLERKLGARSRD